MTVFQTKFQCLNYYGYSTLPGNYCNAEFDDYICWPPTEAGLNVTHPCPRVSSVAGKILGYTTIPEAYATRTCEKSGIWLNNKTNFSRCLEYIDELFEENALQKVVAYIVFIGCLASIISLVLSIIIFSHFRNLHCCRLKVHLNLCIALLIDSSLLFVRSTQTIFDYSDQRINCLCKTLLGLQMYASMASINWMFLEGLLLHNRVAINIFRRDAPFKLYYFIGWGFPGIISAAWGTVMEIYQPGECWKFIGQSKFIYIVVVPIMAVLLTNTAFLINIIRVLVTRPQNSSNIERLQFKKAVRAAALLFPLLGITHLLFIFSPTEEGNVHSVFMVINSLVQSTQGLLVSILYCFMNSDVQTTLRNAYVRSVTIRNSNRRNHSNRTLSHSSHTFTFHSETVSLNLSTKLKLPTRIALKDSEAEQRQTALHSSVRTEVYIGEEDIDYENKDISTVL